jgi:proline iminopeptidase
VLGIEKPIVYGASFGGMVALATSAPKPPEARIPSDASRCLRVWAEQKSVRLRAAVSSKEDAEDMEAWKRLAFPVYTRRPKDPLAVQRGVRSARSTYGLLGPVVKAAPSIFFPRAVPHSVPNPRSRRRRRPDGPHRVSGRHCGGATATSRALRAVPHCGHSVIADAPERAFAIIRDFIGLDSSRG